MLNLILIVIQVPVMDDLEFLKEVTQLRELNLRQKKIYMCTSTILPKDKEQPYLYPMVGFLTKHLTPAGLQNIWD